MQTNRKLETIQTSINHIISEGKKIKPIIEKLEDDNNNLQIKINEAEERSARIQNKINKLKQLTLTLRKLTNTKQ